VVQQNQILSRHGENAKKYVVLDQHPERCLDLRRLQKFGNDPNRRIDLEVPIIYGDNLKTQNRIVVPNSDEFAMFFDTHI